MTTVSLESRVTALEKAAFTTAERIDKLTATVEKNHENVMEHIGGVVHGAIDALTGDLAEFKDDVAENFRRVDENFRSVDENFRSVNSRLDEQGEILRGHSAMLKSFKGMFQAQSEQLREILDRIPPKA